MEPLDRELGILAEFLAKRPQLVEKLNEVAQNLVDIGQTRHCADPFCPYGAARRTDTPPPARHSTSVLEATCGYVGTKDQCVGTDPPKSGVGPKEPPPASERSERTEDPPQAPTTCADHHDRHSTRRPTVAAKPAKVGLCPSTWGGVPQNPGSEDPDALVPGITRRGARSGPGPCRA